jgi:DNA-binding GntR family transcriptional regulator
MDEDQIDHASGVQPWRQLLAILARQIEDGTRTGALPGERHLAAEFGVSAASLRKALAALRDAGLVETVTGFGSRILPPEERGRQG